VLASRNLDQSESEAVLVKSRISGATSGTAWRHANIGRLLNNAVRRFEGRVLELMSEKGHDETRIAHVSLTRNLDVEGTRLTELARRASMSKQAMGELVDQCAELGLVNRIADPTDRRARIVMFTPAGRKWLDAFRDAVDIAEQEMRAELGKATMDAILKGLAVYGAKFGTLENVD
jgi:DNA-binding MarR family transcriptional regulator